jgi:hypothetical protein
MRGDLMELLQELCSLTDPRDGQRISYPLLDLIFMSVCSVVGGAYVGKTFMILSAFIRSGFKNLFA